MRHHRYEGISSFESLETRTLLSGAFVAGHVLHVVGAPTSANTITVKNSADGANVDVTIGWTTKHRVVRTQTASFPKTRVINRVQISGGIKDDVITIDQTASAFAIPTRIFANGGNDTIKAGGEKDVIYGGRGNDNIDAGAGDDLIHGGNGNDIIVGGEGNDSLWGNAGDDNVNGGNGDDTLGGVVGTNALTGGAGKDTFVLRGLDKNPGSDYNSAEDVLKIVPTKSKTDTQQ